MGELAILAFFWAISVTVVWLCDLLFYFVRGAAVPDKIIDAVNKCVEDKAAAEYAKTSEINAEGALDEASRALDTAKVDKADSQAKLEADVKDLHDLVDETFLS